MRVQDKIGSEGQKSDREFSGYGSEEATKWGDILLVHLRYNDNPELPELILCSPCHSLSVSEYRFNRSTGDGPHGVVFDDVNIWVTNVLDGTVTKIRVSDGGTVGTYSVGNGPRGIVFDGANIWVVNYEDDTVTKL